MNEGMFVHYNCWCILHMGEGQTLVSGLCCSKENKSVLKCLTKRMLILFIIIKCFAGLCEMMLGVILGED